MHRQNLEFLLQNSDDRELTDSEKEYSKTLDDCKAKFIAAMDDDLNTAEAIAAIFDIVYASNTALSNENKNAKVVVEKTLDLIHELGGVLGLFQKTQEKSIDAEVEELIEKRNKARSEKNSAEADAIRDKLKAINIELKDTPMGVSGTTSQNKKFAHSTIFYSGWSQTKGLLLAMQPGRYQVYSTRVSKQHCERIYPQHFARNP